LSVDWPAKGLWELLAVLDDCFHRSVGILSRLPQSLLRIPTAKNLFCAALQPLPDELGLLNKVVLQSIRAG